MDKQHLKELVLGVDRNELFLEKSVGAMSQHRASAVDNNWNEVFRQTQ